ncbi:MAG: response regulator [Acidobacteria bacterium]|nr:MAG: response regulator [Acidobacteriota bacterium]
MRTSFDTKGSTTPRPAATVLVVDDDNAFRALVCEVLEARGYRVLAAQNALEAHQISRNFTGRIDLVVVDMRMPLMGGLALAEQLRKKRPLRFLFMSGHAAVTGVGIPWPPGQAAFILKPFTGEQLLGKVQEVLGA